MPLETQGGGHLEGFRGQTFKSLGKLSNGCTDWHRIWYKSADSSGNGRRLNTIRPIIPQGHSGFFLGGHKFKCLGKLSKFDSSNGWTNWHHIWYKSADSSGNGNRLNTIRPSIPQGGFRGVTNSKAWGSCQTTGLIGTKFGTCLRIRLGMDK